MSAYENWAALLAAKELRSRYGGHVSGCPGYQVIGRHTYISDGKCKCKAHELNLAYERACDEIADPLYAENRERGFGR